MARKKNTQPVEVIEMVGNAEVLNTEQNKAVERTALVLQQFGDGLPFDADRYTYVIRGHLTRSAEAMLEAGRALIVAREYLPHGQWTSFIDRIGLADRLAQRMMQAAFKFSNASTSTHLIEAAGSKSKLFELLVLDDEEIKELSEGGSVAGLDLDDVARMSVSELRKALREEREDAKATEQVLAARNAKLDKVEAALQAAKTRIKSSTPDEVISQLRTEFAAQIHGVEHAIRMTLGDGIRQLKDAEGADESTDVFIGTCLQQIQAALDTICADLGVSASTSQRPEWATGE